MTWTSDVLSAHPWLTTPNQRCLLSPDSDGFICGLLLSNLLGWEVVGFYDGKVMAITDGVAAADCVFVDIEVNREVVGSIGHHIISYNNRLLPLVNFEFPNCIQPNQLRGIDGKGSNFQRKYPFGTCHLLITLLHKAGILDGLCDGSSTPLLFTDGVWNNVFGYTENCLEWLDWLGVHGNTHPLAPMFKAPSSILTVMQNLDSFLRVRDQFNAQGVYEGGQFRTGGRNKRTGDKLRLSNSAGYPINLEEFGGSTRVHPAERDRIIGFVKHIGGLMELPYLPGQWKWEDFRIVQFTKGTLPAVTNGKFSELFANHPLSLAMTSGSEVEYTLDPEGKFS